MNPDDPANRPSRRADAAALAFAAVFPSVATCLYILILAANDSHVIQATYGAAKVLQFAFPIIWVLIVRRQWPHIPFALAPAPSPKRREQIAGVIQGLGLGIAVLAVTLLMYFAWLKPAHCLADAAASIVVKASSLGMGTPARFIAGAVLLSSLHAFLEEYYWRWFVFGGLRRYLSVKVAIVVSSLAFTAHHVILLASFFGALTLPAIFFSLCVAIGGAAWAAIYHRSGSLLGPWISHAMIDAGIFIVGYDLLWG